VIPTFCEKPLEVSLETADEIPQTAWEQGQPSAPDCCAVQEGRRSVISGTSTAI
jgi:hypothetical protein